MLKLLLAKLLFTNFSRELLDDRLQLGGIVWQRFDVRVGHVYKEHPENETFWLHYNVRLTCASGMANESRRSLITFASSHLR